MGGVGWHIDGETLLPVIDDIAAFRDAHAADPALDALVALWSGRPAQAEELLRDLLARSNAPRLRALLADTWRDQGRYSDAIAAYETLVAESAGSPREAVMHQHLGKAHFAAGHYVEAHRCFARALDLRLGDGAVPELIASSRLALDRAAELSGRP